LIKSKHWRERFEAFFCSDMPDGMAVYNFGIGLASGALAQNNLLARGFAILFATGNHPRPISRSGKRQKWCRMARSLSGSFVCSYINLPAIAFMPWPKMAPPENPSSRIAPSYKKTADSDKTSCHFAPMALV
jgi:hypothetical protein